MGVVEEDAQIMRISSNISSRIIDVTVTYMRKPVIYRYILYVVRWRVSGHCTRFHHGLLYHGEKYFVLTRRSDIRINLQRQRTCVITLWAAEIIFALSAFRKLRLTTHGCRFNELQLVNMASIQSSKFGWEQRPERLRNIKLCTWSVRQHAWNDETWYFASQVISESNPV